MIMKGSITNANTRASQMAEILQHARMTLSKENECKELSPDETRRLVLLCLLYIVANTELSNKSIQLSEILEYLNISALYEKWFISGNVDSHIQLTQTIDQLSKLKAFDDWKDILDYSCESLEYDTYSYLSLNKKRGVRSNNVTKKDQGIYYTPEDTVLFMVQKCMDALAEKRKLDYCTFLDCSCGTSVFLKSLFLRLEANCNDSNSLDNSLSMFSRCVWGIDKSEKAIDNSIFVFIKYYLSHYSNCRDVMSNIIAVVCHNFHVGDATKLDEMFLDKEGFPVQYDCIIGNPPYVTINRNSNLFIRFVEIIMRYSSNVSCSALVLPLSICYSQGSDFIALRKEIMEDNAKWEFHNYDRSPDSLFGDQVKTRNTIVFRNSIIGSKHLSVTKLQRWTSENRNSIFSQYTLCDIAKIDIQKRIPKLSSDYEIEPYLKFSNGKSCLAALGSSSQTRNYIVMNGTAYNWVCAYDHFPPSIDENGQPYRSSTCSIHYFPDDQTRYFCIAMLSNRFAYWYWTVIGDGFHVNSTFMSEFRIDRNDFSEEQYYQLCRLGKMYCDSIKLHPTVSYNSGKTLINYSHWESMKLIESIELIIQAALNLPHVFCSGIENWYQQQVYCNR